MATVTTRVVGTGVAETGRRTGFIENTLDFSVTGGTSGDTITTLSVEAGTVCFGVGVEVLTIEDSTLTIDVGDGDDPNGYLSGSDIEADTEYTSFDNTTGYAGGRLYIAADTIDVLVNNAADTAKIRVWALIFNVSQLNSQSN